MSPAMRKVLLYSLILVLLSVIFIAGHVIAVVTAEEVETVDVETKKWAFIYKFFVMYI